MYNSSFLPGLPIFLLILLLCFLDPSMTSAQSIIPNGGFEQWETRFLYHEFPPYQTTNRFMFFSSLPVQPNATTVSGCSSSHAIRIENLAIEDDSGNSTTQVGAVLAGNFGSEIFGGLPYNDQPDSIYITLRYDIAAGDEGIIAFFFTTADTTTVSGIFESLTGSQPTCTTIGFDLPAFTAMPDSVALLLSSGSFSTTPIEGGWLEIDSIFFSGAVSALPNSGFSHTLPLEVRDPVDWYSANDIQLVVNGTGGSPMITEDSLHSYEGHSALRITSQLIELDSNIIGIAINGQGLLGDAIGGQPYVGGQSDTLSGWYNYEAVGDDTASVFLRFFSYEPVGDSTIIHLETGIALPPTDGAYACFQIPFELAQMPDSFLIGLGSSDTDNIFSQASPGIGSTLLVDILDFKPCPTVGIDTQLSRSDYKLFPNPAREEIQIVFQSIPGETYHLSLYTLSGQVVQQIEVPANLSGYTREVPINIRSLADGYYVLSLTNEAGDLLMSETFAKQ
ncbi:MAG: T9SS type A sorting domain-containing protein [Bacteroidota bacterium]